MKKIMLFVMLAAASVFSGCVTANPNSEVMIDTNAKTKKATADGASEPGDFERMSDPFLSGN